MVRERARLGAEKRTGRLLPYFLFYDLLVCLYFVHELVSPNPNPDPNPKQSDEMAVRAMCMAAQSGHLDSIFNLGVLWLQVRVRV